MKKFLIVYLIIVVILITGFFGCKLYKGLDFDSQQESISQEQEQAINRKPAVAGQFYPDSKEELERQVNDFLNSAELSQTEGQIIGLIVPHAGYQFSGRVAGFGFKALIDQEIDTVILIGNSHTERFDGISVFKKGSYETPLGKVRIDSELAESLIKENERIFYKDTAHEKEHSLEVQLPFLQQTLSSFKIVPVLFGNSSSQDYNILAQAILKSIKGKNVLLIASSDLSHYPEYDNAKESDLKTVEAILTGQEESLEKTINDLEKENIPGAVTFACAEDSIKTVMIVAKNLAAEEIKLLKYANSGDVNIGDKNRVVGYAAIGFFADRRGNLLSREEQENLLAIARSSVEEYIKNSKVPDFETENYYLNQKIGAFVTLKKQGQLRGCIGMFSPTEIPLYEVVSQMAVSSATKDMRFLPVEEEELSELHYEISVLSKMQKINDWQDIETGKHGVQIRYFTQSGVFLPQVATDNNWTLETFLEQLCYQKVRLEKDCYKRDDVELYIFTAQVFD
ncbi:hypothetical protein AMJ47_00630 [Parcubacteria bacterium DG_72]|nr:MAG: hypothetical protein AMJ47_00630 [Parcubacteria bacterium DG_72]